MPRSFLKTARVAAASVFFLGLTAAFVDFRGTHASFAGHVLAHLQFVPSLVGLCAGSTAGIVVFAAGIAVALLVGRLYCSAICPLGILQDLFFRIGKWLPGKRKFLPHAKPFTLLRQIFFWGSAAGIAAGWAGFTFALVDPYSNFGRIVSVVARPLLTAANNSLVGLANASGFHSLYRVRPDWAAAGVLLPAATFLVIVAVLSARRGRLYCNAVCPVGTALGFASRFAAFRLRIDPDACTRCGDCLRSCKAQCIDLRSGTIDDSRCVACYNCLGACTRNGIRHRFAWTAKRARLPVGKPEPSSRGPEANPPRRQFLSTLATGAFAAAFLSRKAGAEPSPSTSETSTLAKRGEAGPAICPPGAQSVARFLDRCTACHLCISACPTHVLRPAFLEYGAGGLFRPHLEYVSAYCLYECKTCSEVCPDGALSLPDLATKQVTQIALADFHQSRCIVEVNGTDCAACSEHCPTKAISTVPYRDNLRLPVLNQSLCVGCGACQYACPVRPLQAFLVTPRAVHARAEKFVEKKATAPVPSDDFPF